MTSQDQAGIWLGQTATAPTAIGGRRRSSSLLLAFIRRDLAEGNLFRATLMLDLIYGMINLVSFLFISRTLHHPVSSLDGAPTYFDFVAVGLAYLLVMQATCAQLISRIQQQQRSGTLETIVALPIATRVIAIGLGAFPAAFGILRSSVYLGCAGLFLGLRFDRTEWFGLAVMLLLGAVAALALGIGLAALIIAWSPGATAGRMAVVAIGFLSGVYFPVAALPVVAQWISVVLPTRMAIDGMRAAIAGGPWLSTAALLTVTALLMLMFSCWLFARALARARRVGSLTQA